MKLLQSTMWGNGRRNKKFRTPVYLVVVVLAASCGGHNKDNNDTNTDRDVDAVAPVAGQFLDSPVINLRYQTASLSGITNSLGQFHYRSGEHIIFSIGDLVLPAVTGADILTPLSVFNVAETSDPRVINLVRLLQSIDSDNNPANGITISDLAITAATQLDFSLSLDAFEQSAAVLNFIANAGQQTPVTQLISIADAIAHFESQLTAASITFTPYENPNAEPSVFCQPPDGARENDWFANIDSPLYFRELPAEVLNSSNIEDVQRVMAKSIFEGKLLAQGMGFSAAMGLNLIRCEISTPGNYCTDKPSTSTSEPLVFDVIKSGVTTNRYNGNNMPYWNGTFTSLDDSELVLSWGRSQAGNEFVGWTSASGESFYATEDSNCAGSARFVEEDASTVDGVWTADGAVEVTFCGEEGCQTYTW